MSSSADRLPGGFDVLVKFLTIGVIVIGALVLSGPILVTVLLTALLLIPLAILPEVSFVVLTMGMFVFSALPGPLESVFDGIAIPLVVSAATVSILIVVYRRLAVSGKISLPRPASTDILVAAFALWLWIGISWSPDPEYGRRKILGFTLYTVVPYLLVRWGCAAKGFDIRRLVGLMLLAGVAHAMVILDFSIQSGSLRPDTLNPGFRRLMSTTDFGYIGESDAITLGLLATTVLAFLWRGRRLWILVPTYMFQLWALMRLQQRGAALALIAGTIVLLLCLLPHVGSRKKSRTFYGLLLIPFLVVGGYFLYVSNPQLQADYIVQDQSVLVRLRFYFFAWQAFLGDPLIGVGTGGSGLALTGGVGLYERFYVHNRLLEVMVELGLVGAILFTALSVSLLRRFLIGLRRASSMPLLIGLVATGCFLLARYTVGMFSGDLAGWNIGVWAGFVVAFSQSTQTTDS